MRQLRKRQKRTISLLGYHPTDVQEYLQAQQRQLSIVEMAMKQEEEGFQELYRQKRVQLAQLEVIFAVALEEEERLLKGRGHP